MQKYLLTSEEFTNRKIISHINHIMNVMRMKINDEIIISSNGKPYIASICSISNEGVGFNIVKELNELTEMPITIDIVQGYAKGEKMDFIIQKTTELGVNGIYPIVMERSIVRITDDKKQAKLDRMNKIALEAARQSHRNLCPVVYPIFDLKGVNYDKYDIIVVAYEEEAHNNENSLFKATLQKILNGMNVLFIVGPEGGLSNKEIDFLKDKGAICCAIGPRILRTETASLYMLSALSYELELKI